MVFKYSNAFFFFSRRGARLRDEKAKKISYNTLIKNKTLSQFDGDSKKEKDSVI